MPVTYNLIASNTLSSSAASVTFSAIPGTYTDLVLRCSVRDTNTGISGGKIAIQLNNDSSASYGQTLLRGNGASATSFAWSAFDKAVVSEGQSSGSTSNTFASIEIYIPNYAGSTKKPFGNNAAMETNGTTAYLYAIASLYDKTNAITSIKIFNDGSSIDLVSGSSFFLYGIKNS